jgi:hypothetical protein
VTRARESAWRTTIIVAVVTFLLSVVIAEAMIRSVTHQNRAQAR